LFDSVGAGLHAGAIGAVAAAGGINWLGLVQPQQHLTGDFFNDLFDGCLILHEIITQLLNDPITLFCNLVIG
jgi:hypothetical protein